MEQLQMNIEGIAKEMNMDMKMAAYNPYQAYPVPAYNPYPAPSTPSAGISTNTGLISLVQEVPFLRFDVKMDSATSSQQSPFLNQF